MNSVEKDFLDLIDKLEKLKAKNDNKKLNWSLFKLKESYNNYLYSINKNEPAA